MRRHRWLPALVLTVCLMAAASLALYARARAAAPSPERSIAAAWQRAQQIGAYRFQTDLLQTTHAAPALASVGQGSREETIHLSGQLDQAAQRVQMRLWQGAAWDDSQGVEMRLEGVKAFGRAPGGEW